MRFLSSLGGPKGRGNLVRHKQEKPSFRLHLAHSAEFTLSVAEWAQDML